jgi:hypothetical protein
MAIAPATQVTPSTKVQRSSSLVMLAEIVFWRGGGGLRAKIVSGFLPKILSGLFWGPSAAAGPAPDLTSLTGKT